MLILLLILLIMGFVFAIVSLVVPGPFLVVSVIMLYIVMILVLLQQGLIHG